MSTDGPAGGRHAGPVETAPTGTPDQPPAPTGQPAAPTGEPAAPAGQPPVTDVPPQGHDPRQGTGDTPFADDSTVRRSDLDASQGDAGRGHLDPEPRPDAEQQHKPGLMDKVRGKVDDLRGDERPRS